MDMNYCRRCGRSLQQQQANVFACEDGHTLYRNSSPAVGIILVNDKKETLVAVRGIEPGKGKLDMPGGFCDDAETAEAALERELREELHLEPSRYSPPQYL